MILEIFTRFTNLPEYFEYTVNKKSCTLINTWSNDILKLFGKIQDIVTLTSTYSS